jgi:hypothetical protein
LELAASPALERIHDLARDYVNFLHPVRKLTSKTRDGARVRRSYDAARTPFHCLVDSGVLSIQMTRELKARSANVDPIRLKLHLEAAQHTLAARAARSDSYVRQPCALRQNFPDPGGASCVKTDPTGADDDAGVQQSGRHDPARASEAADQASGQILCRRISRVSGGPFNSRRSPPSRV